VLLDSSQTLRGLFLDRNVRAEDNASANSAGSLNAAIDSHDSRSLQQQQDGSPSICEIMACKKMLITSCFPVFVHHLSYTALTFEKSCIPPHTSAHKHGKRKDISELCNEGENHEPHDVMVVQGFASLLTQGGSMNKVSP
jgi:hypothetical protein